MENMMETDKNIVNGNVYTERRPMTTKEIKFFGTAISFDEQMGKKSIGKPKSPKFLRTQSSGVLSPKLNRSKLFSTNSSSVGRDKNSNYTTLNYLTKASSISMEKACNINCADTRNQARVNKLMLVKQCPAIDLDVFDENDEFVSNGLQRLNKLNRIKCMRMNQFLSSRSLSYENWCDNANKR